MKTFFNYIIEVTDLNIKSPCNTASLSKTFKMAQRRPRKILDKETVDEIIFKSGTLRDRLILELQARCGLRIGEVLNLPATSAARRLRIIQKPKSGRDEEVAFMPEHISVRLTEYIASQKLSTSDRVFPVCYSTVWKLVTGLGMKLNVSISPHNRSQSTSVSNSALCREHREFLPFH